MLLQLVPRPFDVQIQKGGAGGRMLPSRQRIDMYTARHMVLILNNTFHVCSGNW